MKTEIQPQHTNRSAAFEMWISSPMPMVTMTKTMNVTRLVRHGRRHNRSFNMLMCWAIAKAASRLQEFYILPCAGRLFKYDTLAVNTIVQNKAGGINSCDIPFSEDLNCFSSDYTQLTMQAKDKCQSTFLEESMIIGTSAMIQTELDTIVNQYTDKFSNPMVFMGQIQKALVQNPAPCLISVSSCADGRNAGSTLPRILTTRDKQSVNPTATLPAHKNERHHTV